jgi:hypothetical protein
MISGLSPLGFVIDIIYGAIETPVIYGAIETPENEIFRLHRSLAQPYPDVVVHRSI